MIDGFYAFPYPCGLRSRMDPWRHCRRLDEQKPLQIDTYCQKEPSYPTERQHGWRLRARPWPETSGRTGIIAARAGRDTLGAFTLKRNKTIGLEDVQPFQSERHETPVIFAQRWYFIDPYTAGGRPSMSGGGSASYQGTASPKMVVPPHTSGLQPQRLRCSCG